MDRVLEVQNLHVSYFTRRGEVRAVNGVTFQINKGEVFGLAGESGCGKSTVAYAIMRLIKPPGRIMGGRIIVDGIDVLNLKEEELRSFRWKKVAMVFQNAMNCLNPVFRIGDQIAEAIMIHENISKREALARAKYLLSLVGIHESRVNDYPHQLSGGMRQRVNIAMALALNPIFLIVDEPTTALDVVVARQILELLWEMKNKFNLSMLFITHDLAVLSEFSNRIGIMYAGELVELANTQRLFTNPLHPYTKGLIKSLMGFTRRGEKLWSIPGSPPDLASKIEGCKFRARCPIATSKCSYNKPRLVEIEPNHFVACHEVAL
jgi:peptide/nickel transport system ATP-binding protein